jgi:hypothetical protein
VGLWWRIGRWPQSFSAGDLRLAACWLLAGHPVSRAQHGFAVRRAQQAAPTRAKSQMRFAVLLAPSGPLRRPQSSVLNVVHCIR